MRSMDLQDRRILLCVGGGIAAYKSCEVARLLVKAGARVRVALTPAAQRFVTAARFVDECCTFRRIDLESRLMDAFDRRPMVHHRLVHVGLLDPGVWNRVAAVYHTVLCL